MSYAPYVISLLSDNITPQAAFQALCAGQPFAFLFESTEGDSRLARYSFVGVNPSHTITFQDGHASVSDRLGQTSKKPCTDPLQVLREFVRERALVAPPGLNSPFTGGLVGCMGYAATRYIEKIQQQAEDPIRAPEGLYGFYDCVVVFDHHLRRIHVVSHGGEKTARSVVENMLAMRATEPLPEPAELEEDLFEGVVGSHNRQSFVDLVGRAKEFICQGQVFQIVLSQRFSLPVAGDPLNIYRLLQSINPSPYAYFLKFPSFCYLGSSPETFVRCQDGEVVLRALAGTRPRGSTQEEDGRLAEELCSDEKELAEHRMLVDLGRNDLGKICRPGSIAVGETARVSRYTHVMHLATEIKGSLEEGKDCYDAFRACFPRGTVSGAPKVRAMQLLAELEHERRGIYSGVVGYFDISGNMDGAIAIRSALVRDGLAHVHAGAGIVYDSDQFAEYEETRNKARSVIKAIKLAEGCLSNAAHSNR